MKILRFNEISGSLELTEDFFKNFEYKLDESSSDEKGEIEEIIKKVKADLKLHLSLSTTFGTGIALMMPIVQNLIKNWNLNIEANRENLVLLILTSFAIIYLEHQKGLKNPDPEKLANLERDSKTLLTELKLKGIGNGIVKKLIKVFDSIVSLFNLIFKNLGVVAKDLLDMLAYTAMLVPFINSISFIIGKYELDFDTFIGNFASLGFGITSLIAKHGIDYIINKLQNVLGLDYSDVFKVGDFSTSDLYRNQQIDSKIDTKEKSINEQ
jgi:hypothetical protein